TPGGKFFQAALNALAVCVFHVSILVVENNERGKSASTSQDGADRTLTHLAPVRRLVYWSACWRRPKTDPLREVVPIQN
ncbi:MAG: hypothetical protein Q8R67_14945, partial [Rhodoferax sp.]